MVVHRDDAGELDADGWTLAKSTNGNYSVDLPMKFKDFIDAVKQVGAFWAVLNEPPPGSAPRGEPPKD